MITETEPSRPVALDRRLQSRRWLAPVFLFVVIAGLAVLLVAGVVPRLVHHRHLEEIVAATVPSFTVATAAPGETKLELALPSSVEAVQETPLYPRVNGYVKTLAVDIGSLVQAGDVLAEIETPELDQQVVQARAALEQAQANFHLAKTSFGRWEEMQKTRVVAPQEVDDRRGAFQARQADVTAAQANLERLAQTQRFQKITAPFAGTVTKRMIEVGQLVTGDLNDNTRILFQLEQTSALRAFINVPQSAFRFVAVGQPVAITFRDLPGRTFSGEVVRTAGALDGATRTLRTEVRIPNESGELIPGLYAEVKLQTERTQPPVAVPARAVILQSSGPQIAKLDVQNRVTLASVSLGRDTGKTIEVLSGLSTGARFITNPSDTVRDGLIIREATSNNP